MKRVGAYYGDIPPVNPMPGMLWYDTKEDDLTMYMFYENPDTTTVWVPVYSPTKSNSGGSGYVKKTGDDMLGNLSFSGTNQVKTRFVNSAENSKLQLQFNNNTKVWVGGSQITVVDADIKITKNNAKIVSNTDNTIFQINDNGAFYLGVITNDLHVVNKEYSDTQDNIIAQRVVELEEEIRAIAPGIDKGVWEWDANGNYPRDPGAGNFYLVRSNFSVTDSYSDAEVIVINNNDRTQPPVNHTWGGILGKLIQIYDAADPDYILGEITAVDNTSNASYTFITINRLQSRGGPTEVDSNGKNTVRMSIFEAPEGGSASEFVRKSGDIMTGDLTMDDADILLDNGDLEFEAKGDTAYIQDANNRFGKIVSRSPKDTDLDSPDYSSEFGIKVDLNEGSTTKNKLKVGNSKGDIITISSGSGPQIVLGGNEFTGAPGQSGLTGGVPILGVPTPSFENSPGDIAVNKEYVDTRDELLRQDIIELEEEIDAIASGFVLKSGDTMSGDLAIDRSTESTDVEAALTLTGSRSNTTNSTATIAFENSQSTTPGYLTYRAYGASSWFAFNQDVDLNNKGLHSVAQVRMKPGGYIGSASNPRLTFNNASNATDGSGLLVVPRPSENRRGFTIRGNDADGNEQDMLYTYTNISGTPDAVNYIGKMDSDTNLVNKAYVDAAVSPGTILIADVGKWRYGGLEGSTLERYQYFGLEKKGSTSTYIPYSNILYLDKLIVPDGTLQPLEDYTPTDVSMLEVYVGNELYFKGILNPTTYKVSSRSPDEIECEFTTEYALISKGSTDWSTTTSYRLILTGMRYTG